MKNVLFLLFLFVGLSANAVINITGTVTHTFPVSICDDIVIKNGGTLFLDGTSGTHVTLSLCVGNEIKIEEGGKLIVRNGTITCFSGNWQGINIDPATPGSTPWHWAVDLRNSNITKANIGMFSPLGQMQRVRAEGTTFTNNDKSIRFWGSWANMFASNNDVFIKDCSFYHHTNFWPLEMGYLGNCTFDNCLFDYTGTTNPQAAIQFAGSNNLNIRNCEFQYTGLVGIDFTQVHYNATIENNEFLYNGTQATGPLGYQYIAILLGHDPLADQIEGFTIHENNFFHPGPSGGVYCGVYENALWTKDMTITENDFIHYNTGIYSMNNSYLANPCLTKKNVFKENYTAIKVKGNNLAHTLECNNFENSFTCIFIDNSSSLKQLNLQDFGNHFEQGVFHVFNLGSSLVVDASPLNPWRIDWTKTFGPVFGGSTSTLLCAGKKVNAFDVNVHPNPAEDELTIELGQTGEEAKYEIRNLSGQLLYSGNTTNGKVQLAIDLPTGIYMVNVVRGDQVATQKLFIK